MLILTRRVTESIIINGNITVTVIEIDGTGQVRIGVQAPPDMGVHRAEVAGRIRREGRDPAKRSQLEAGAPRKLFGERRSTEGQRSTEEYSVDREESFNK